MTDHTIGDGPIEEQYALQMQALAQVLNEYLNEPGKPPTTGFLLMMFPFNDHGGRCNYISNARREDVVLLLREQLARFEGRAVDQPGHA